MTDFLRNLLFRSFAVASVLGLLAHGSFRNLSIIPRVIASVVTLDQQGDKYQQQLEADPISGSDRQRLYSQIYFLQKLKDLLGPPEGCAAELQFEGTHLEGASNFYAKLHQGYVSQISVEDVWLLSQYINSHLSDWRLHPGRPIPSCLIQRAGGGGSTPVDFRLNDEGHLFVDFHFPPNSGSFGSVYTLFGYGTQDNAAKKVTKVEDSSVGPPKTAHDQKVANDKAAALKYALHEEQSHLHMISKLPRESRMGLVDTLSVKGGEILQLLYDRDWESQLQKIKRLENPPAILPILRLFAQLGEGLKTLHTKLGMVHSDIKPNNILVSMMDQDLYKGRAVHADFGLSYIASEELKNDPHQKPIRGTPGFMPPEAFEPWIGLNDEQRIINAQKGDVYALNVTLALALRPNLLTWQSCGFPQNPGYQDCYRHNMKLLAESQLANPDPIDAFLLKGLSADLAERPTAAEWKSSLIALMHTLGTSTGAGLAGVPGGSHGGQIKNANLRKRLPPDLPESSIHYKIPKVVP